MIKRKIDEIKITPTVCVITHSNYVSQLFVRPRDIRQKIVEVRISTGHMELFRNLGESRAIIWTNQNIMNQLLNWSV